MYYASASAQARLTCGRHYRAQHGAILRAPPIACVSAAARIISPAETEYHFLTPADRTRLAELTSRCSTFLLLGGIAWPDHDTCSARRIGHRRGGRARVHNGAADRLPELRDSTFYRVLVRG